MPIVAVQCRQKSDDRWLGLPFRTWSNQTIGTAWRQTLTIESPPTAPTTEPLHLIAVALFQFERFGPSRKLFPEVCRPDSGNRFKFPLN
jgi:hypothetical protein